MRVVFSGYPNLLTIHGNMRLIARVTRAKPFSFPWLAARLESLTIPRSFGVVCITNHTRQAVTVLARRTWVVPNAVDSAFFDVSAVLENKGVPSILSVGLVCPLKNQNAFIQALDPLPKRHKFELVFLGNTSPARAYDDSSLPPLPNRPTS